MKRAVLVTGHYFESKRKAGFHWLAEALVKSGWEVTFFTSSLSLLSRLRGDYRFEYPVLEEANRLKPVRERLWSYVWYTPWHPANLRAEVLNWLASPLFARYGSLALGEAEARFREADLVIFESGPALVMFDRVRVLNPRARMVYRVSDDLRMLKNHRTVLATEDRVAPLFDLVSVPSEFIFRRFAVFPNARLHTHGVDKSLFEGEFEDPFRELKARGRRQAVFVGNSFFDMDFLERASRLIPEIDFHIVGPIGGLPARPNVHAYGEIPFLQTLPFLRSADIGLMNRAYSPGAESLTDSLKVIQYTWCRLPIVAPEFLRSEKPHLFCYTPGDDASVGRALEQALAFDRARVPVQNVRSWDELAAVLSGEAPA